MPTQAIVVARQRLIWDVGLDIGKMLHGEQTLTLHRPLPPAAELLADAWVAEVFDKGAEKGSILQLEGTARNVADNEALFSWTSMIFARGDGGIGGLVRKGRRRRTPSRPARPTPSSPPRRGRSRRCSIG